MNFKAFQSISKISDRGSTDDVERGKCKSFLLNFGDEERAVPQGGFTLIELVAVISVMVIISAVVLVNHTRFGNQVLLTNLAYDISLSIRQAQQFGTAVREAETTVGTTFDTGYGVHFDSDLLNSYTLFADIDRNKEWGSPPDESVEEYLIRRGRIAIFCAELSDGSLHCSDPAFLSLGLQIRFLDIVFDRPQPGLISNANLTGKKPGGEVVVDCERTGGVTPCYLRAIIAVEDLQMSSTRYVIVEMTGQISVQ